MKLQNLALIFIAIVVPISLLLGYYVNTEIDTLKLQAKYDEKLITATYDAIKAYQINTKNNYYSIINKSQRRDIEASVNTFMDTFATGIGKSGYGETQIKPYVPAILFALYDGYYIYSPTLNEETGKYEHLIKPYFTYTARYKKGTTTDVYISYTLDNYITVTGKAESQYINESGYLVNDNYSLAQEELEEMLLIYDETAGAEPYLSGPYKYIYNGGEKKYYDSAAGKWFIYLNGKKQYYIMDSTVTSATKDANAQEYMDDAKTFTNKIKRLLGDLETRNLVVSDEVKDRNDIYGINKNLKLFDSDFEKEDSVFNTHRRDIMKMSIKENLTAAITTYNAHSGALGTNKLFQMPNLTETDWDQITKNICAIAFVQGLPMGFKTYNNYAIINNTRNENYVDRDNLAFIDLNDPNGEYHKIDCPYLTTGNIIGYRKIDFEDSAVEIKKGSERKYYYYYKHTNLPCYYCIVSGNYTPVSITGNKLKALRQVLARERQMLHY